MTDQSYHVYVIQGHGQRDYSKTRDADALVTSASPITRSVMSALEGPKVVARTGVGYDVVESLDGTKAQLTERPFSARPPIPPDQRPPQGQGARASRFRPLVAVNRPPRDAPSARLK